MIFEKLTGGGNAKRIFFINLQNENLILTIKQ